MKNTQVTFRFHLMASREEQPNRFLLGTTPQGLTSLVNFKVEAGELLESIEKGLQSRLCGTLNPQHFTNRSYFQHLVWADQRLCAFFTDTETADYVPKPSDYGRAMDLNLFGRMYELSGKPPSSVKLEKLQDLEYRPAQMNQPRLHSVLNHGLRLLRGNGYWKKLSPYQPAQRVQLNLQGLSSSLIRNGLKSQDASTIVNLISLTGMPRAKAPSHQLRLAV